MIAAGLAIGIVFGVPGLSPEGPASAGRAALPQTDGPLVLYTEFSSTSDTIFAADPEDPENRSRLAAVPHAPGYAINGALSPDGTRVAYTVLPPSIAGVAPDAPAELWLLDLASGSATLLAGGLDLLVAPVWSPDGGAVVVRRSTWDDSIGGRYEMLLIGLDGSAGVLANSRDGLYPVGFSPDAAALYYATASEAGTDLLRIDLAGGAIDTVAHLSDGFARDWSISPDGTRLAYLAGAPGVAFEARLLDLATGAGERAIAGGPSEAFSPAWHPDGGLTLGRLAGAATLAAGRAKAPPGPTTGFDAPLAWSPDGAFLAARAFEGASLSDPGRSHAVVIGPDGQRRRLSDLSDVMLLGWLEPLP